GNRGWLRPGLTARDYNLLPEPSPNEVESRNMPPNFSVRHHFAIPVKFEITVLMTIHIFSTPKKRGLHVINDPENKSSGICLACANCQEAMILNLPWG